MSLLDLTLAPLDKAALAEFPGRLVVLVDDPAKPGPLVAQLDRRLRGAIARCLASEAFGALKSGEGCDLAHPSGLAAEALHLVRLPRRATAVESRRAGGSIARAHGKAPTMVVADRHPGATDLALGILLRGYEFSRHKSAEAKPKGPVTLALADPAALDLSGVIARAEGVHLTRDLVNEPANVLGTEEFADRLLALNALGVKVEVLDEPRLRELGMGALLGVGQGSARPSKVVVMEWKGGGEEAPLALIGKGVVFDTGGISIKPAGGMEEMTADMGGAGVVAGVMSTLARRKAKANVVGLVGLVENMPDGLAQRPGDVVRSMKGDTIEVINTDAEGRLVLADVLWYAQDRFKPRAMIDLATLTGAVIIALGTENAGVFSNDDALCEEVLKAAGAEGEGAWRLPMGEAYDAKLKSRVADMMNVGGREGGSITAAQFLKRFVKEGQPWVHLDIAGVALMKSEGDTYPKGASGWGVLSLDRLVSDNYES